MTIKIVFDSFDEMMRYADRLKNGTLFDQTGKIVDEGPAQENLPEKKVEGTTAGNSIPYGRQIAPHFPNANVSQQPGAAAAPQQMPVQQAAPVSQQAVQTTVPAQQPPAPQQAAQTPHAAQQAAPMAAAPGAVPLGSGRIKSHCLATLIMKEPSH